MKRFVSISLAILVIIPALAGCGAVPADPPTASPLPPESMGTAAPATPAALRPAATAQPTTTSVVEPTDVLATPPNANATDTSAACPQPTDDMFLLRYPPGGYCLLYPDSYTAVRGGFDQWSPSAFRIVQGSILNTSTPWATVTTGEAAGVDPEKIAREAAASMEEHGVGLIEMEVAGEPAFMVTGIPGQDLTRSLYFNHGDVSFHFTFGPDDTAGSETAEALDEFVDGLLGRLTFIPVRDTFTAADECLEPRTNEQLIVNETLGYCVLLPSGYTLEQTGPNSARMAAGSGADTHRPQLLVEVIELGEQPLDAAVATATAGTTMLDLLTVADGTYLSWLVPGAAGADFERVLLLYYEDQLHRLTFVPADPPQQEWRGETAEFVALVTRTFRLLRERGN